MSGELHPRAEKESDVSSLFDERVYAVLRRVPRGKVTTYKALAEALGTKAYRAVGQALNRNPYAPAVPCHRVVCSDGSIGGFAHGTGKKIKMLREEGVEVVDGRIKNVYSKIFAFDRKS